MIYFVNAFKSPYKASLFILYGINWYLKVRVYSYGWIARNLYVSRPLPFTWKSPLKISICAHSQFKHKFSVGVAYNQLKIFFCNLVLGSNNRFFLKKGRFYCFSRKLGILSFGFPLSKERMWNQIFCNVISIPGC